MPDVGPALPPFNAPPDTSGITNGLAQQIPASALQQPISKQSPAPSPQQNNTPSVQDIQKSNAQVLEQPETQKLMQLATSTPEAPQVPVQEYKSSLNVFKDLVPALAILGGSFTKQALTTTLDAATGAMTGFNEGQQIQGEEKMKEFHESLEKYNAMNKQVENAQKVVFDKDGNVNYASLASYAAAHGNAAMLEALKTNPVFAASMYSNKMKADLELQKLQVDIGRTLAETDKAKAEADKARSSASASLSEDTLHRMVGQYIDGNADVLKYVGRGGNATANFVAFQNALSEEMVARGMTPEQINQKMIDFKGRVTAQNAKERTVATLSTKLDSARNMLDESIPSLLDQAKKVGLYGSTDWNSFVNTFKAHMNDPKFANFRTQVRAVTSDYAQFIGRGTGTVHSDEEALKVLSTDMDFSSLQGFADAIKTESDNTKRAMDQTQKDVEGDTSKPSSQTISDGWSIQKM